MQIDDYLSILDTQRFGFKIAKINEFENFNEDVLDFLKNHDVKLILSKVPTENIKLINKLEKLNFTIKDIQVTYKFDIPKLGDREKINDNIIVRDFNKNDIPDLQQIAFDSFLNYGHYANDDRLDIQKCNEIYSDWIKRSCEDRNVADKILVAEYKGETAGFLSFKIYEKGNYKYAAGGIGAVSAKFRNMNIFKLLTTEGLHWGKAAGLDHEEHNVLINNYPVNKSFIKSGFYVYKSFISMHHWID